MNLENKKIGFAVTGSFCTLSKAIKTFSDFSATGCDLYPIMSENTAATDTRFGKASDFEKAFADISGKNVIKSIKDAEPIGPKKLLDLLVILPCTGNTLAKLANGITDSSVTMAAKAHLRNKRPVLIGVSTNDGLGTAARNIGTLLNAKNIFFIPFEQDDSEKKPCSLVATFELAVQAAESALEGIQLQPLLNV